MLEKIKRNLLFLNSMPFEMLINQGRLWEVTNRSLGGYCQRSCSIFFRSEKYRVIEMEPGKNICYCIPNRFEKIKISFLRYIFRILYVLFLALRIREICKDNRIDAIVSQSNALRELELASIIVSKVYNIPMFGYIGRNPTGFEFDKFSSIEKIHIGMNKFVVKLERAILKKVDRVILRPGTERSIGKLFRIDPSKIVSIPHKTKFDQFIHCIKIPGDLEKWMEGKTIVMSYSRIGADKFIDDMIKSINLVKKNHKEVYLLVIGDGEEKENLKILANKLGMDNYVRFENSMTQQQIAAIAHKCNIILQLGGGKGMFESALMGKPLITYDIDMGHYFGLVEHMKTALVAKNRNVESMAECIISYLNDPALGERLGQEMQRRAIEHNNWAETDKKLATAIEEAIFEKQT